MRAVKMRNGWGEDHQRTEYEKQCDGDFPQHFLRSAEALGKGAEQESHDGERNDET